MFRIKQDDYNTVQFMPDYKSSEASKKKQKPAPAVESIGSKPQKARARRNLIIVLVIAIVVCVAGWYVYSHYFTDDAKYIRAFNEANYGTAGEIAKESKGSGSFSDKIGDTVISAADKELDQYKKGKVNANDAIAALTKYDEASAGLFNDHIQKNIDAINAIEGVYASVNQAADLAQNGQYDKSLDSLKSSIEGAAANSLNIDPQITKVLTDNLLGFKETLFSEYSVQIRWAEDLSSVKDSLAFVNTYISDPDFTAFNDTISQVESKKLRRSAAAATARQISKSAKAQRLEAAQAAAQQAAGAADTNAAGAAAAAQ